MSADSSTLQSPELSVRQEMPSAVSEWRRFRSFVRRPVLHRQSGRFSFVAVQRMLALDMMLMMALFMLAAIALAFGVTLPENSNSDLEPTLATFALAVVLAPVAEELLFRGPLSGKLAHLLTLVIALTAFIAIAAIKGATLLTVVVILVALLGIALLKITLGGRPPMRWFARMFPLFFWLSCIGFAILHFVNYQDGLAWILVPLVAPQFILGTICGYLRVLYGLWSSVLLHALHNATALGIAFLVAPLFG